MQGVVFTGGRELELMNFPDPTPGPGEVVLEMKASGMCGSDLHQYRRPKNRSAREPGCHSIQTRPSPGMSRAVLLSPSARTYCRRRQRSGERVMVHHYTGCTQLQPLPLRVATALPGRCRSKYMATMPMAATRKYMKVPADTLVPLHDELSFAAGAAIACGSGTAYGALRRMNIAGRDTIAIFGQGPVGLAGTQFAKAMGAARHRAGYQPATPGTGEGIRRR